MKINRITILLIGFICIIAVSCGTLGGDIPVMEGETVSMAVSADVPETAPRNDKPVFISSLYRKPPLSNTNMLIGRLHLPDIPVSDIELPLPAYTAENSVPIVFPVTEIVFIIPEIITAVSILPAAETVKPLTVKPAPEPVVQQEKSLPADSVTASVPPGMDLEVPAPVRVISGERSLSSGQGEELTVELDGRGWIFTGEETGKNGIGYKSRNITDTATFFHFDTDESGEYVLLFQYQNLESGVVRKEKIFLSIGEFEKVITESGEDDKLSGDYTIAEMLYNQGKKAEAFAEYVSRYVPGSYFINDRIASLAFDLGKFSDAAVYWEKNLDAPDLALYSSAVKGVMKSSIEGDDAVLADRHAGRYLDLPEPPSGDELIRTGDFLGTSGMYVNAARFYEEFAARYGFGKGGDRVFYALGGLYEKDSPIRDERRSIEYYSVVTERYPVSLFWERANDRIRYLQRHFINVR